MTSLHTVSGFARHFLFIFHYYGLDTDACGPGHCTPLKCIDLNRHCVYLYLHFDCIEKVDVYVFKWL